MEETQFGPSWDGSVVLDIGGDVGALVLRVPPALAGHEIDLQPEDPTQPHTHSAVRERHHGEGVIYAAVYPALVAGTYLVEGSGQRVTIEGGHVSDVEYVV